MEYQSINVRVPKDLYEHLRREAYERRISQAAIVTDALEGRYAQADHDGEGGGL